MEEFLLKHQLYILNEESQQTTFRSPRGASNIDITVTNGRLLSRVTDQDSCSDHIIIKYVIRQTTAPRLCKNNDEARCKVNDEGKQKFQENLLRLSEQKYFKNQNAADLVAMEKNFMHKSDSRNRRGEIGRRIPRSPRRGVQNLIPGFKGVEVKISKKNGPMVVG